MKHPPVAVVPCRYEVVCGEHGVVVTDLSRDDARYRANLHGRTHRAAVPVPPIGVHEGKLEVGA